MFSAAKVLIFFHSASVITIFFTLNCTFIIQTVCETHKRGIQRNAEHPYYQLVLYYILQQDSHIELLLVSWLKRI